MAADLFNRPMGTTVKYNPHLWSEDELRDIFVVRRGQLADLLDRIRSTPPDVVPQPTLLVGARGMGKTTLLRRLALAVRDDAELSRQWLPLSFPEEQYTVSSLGELWRNVLDALIDALEHAGASRAEIADLDRKAQELAEHGVESQADEVLALLEAWYQAHQRRLLLLIDSTDLLLEGLKTAPLASSRKSSETRLARKAQVAAVHTDSALWQLRSTLLQSRHLMWVGATYQSLESQHAYDDAFHDFFDLIELGPLGLDDMRAALVALAGRFGMRGSQTSEQAAQAMRHELDTRPERILALKAITGGNPRTTAILYDLFATGHDGDLHSDLRGLLDLMTPLYKARMEQLPEQPRKLLAHIMEAWEPISLRDLAQVSGVANTTISSQLVRLEHDGLVQKTLLSGTSRSGFQITERFFNIWFLMRHASRRVRQRLMWLVEFMRLWYRRDELEGIALRRTSFHRRYAFDTPSQAEYSRAVARAMPADHALRIQLDYAVYREARKRAEASHQRIGDIYPELFDLQGEDKYYESGEQCHQRFLEVKAKLLAVAADPAVDVNDWARRVLGAAEATLGEKRALAAATDRLTAEKATRVDLFPKRKLTRRLLAYAFDMHTLEAVEAAMADSELLPDCADLTFYRAQIATRFGDDPAATQLALLAFMRTADKESRLEVARTIERMSPARAGVLLLLGRELADVDPERATTWLAESVRIDSAATPWAELLTAHHLHVPLERYDEAEAAYLKAIALDGANVWSWSGLGDLLQYHLKRYEEAEASYRKAIALDDADPWIWSDLGNLLQNHLKRYDEAEAAYRKAIALDDANAWSWNNLGNVLQAYLKRYDEAEAAYRKAIALDAADAAPWNNLGNLLQDHLERYDEAETAYRKAIALDAAAALPWNNLGTLLHDHLGRYDEAATGYRKAIDLDEADVSAWKNLGNLLQYRLNRYDEAEAVWRKAIALDEADVAPWNDLGCLLQDHLNRPGEAETIYEAAERIAPRDPFLLANHARLLVTQGEDAKATAHYRKLLDLLPNIELGSIDDADNLRLQAHLWLGNADLASQALDRLVDLASKGDTDAFSILREQVFECHRMGIGAKLADLFARSSLRDFLLPLEVALRVAVEGSDEPLLGTPAETEAVAREVLRDLLGATTRPIR